MTIKEQVANRLLNLLTIKSLVTLILTIVIAVMVLSGMEAPQFLISIFQMVIGFYFGTQFEQSKTAIPKEEIKEVEDKE